MSQTEAAESTFEWMDAQLESLSENKEVWAKLDISARIAVLGEVAELADKAAERWVTAALQAKGLAPESPLAGEEWSSGPWALLYGLDHILTLNASTGSTMFLRLRAPIGSKATSVLPAACSATVRETQTPPGSAAPSSRAATLTPSP